jgi:hypothetical protein
MATANGKGGCGCGLFCFVFRQWWQGNLKLGSGDTHHASGLKRTGGCAGCGWETLNSNILYRDVTCNKVLSLDPRAQAPNNSRD